jgi:hypothetical protein
VRLKKVMAPERSARLNKNVHPVALPTLLGKISFSIFMRAFCDKTVSLYQMNRPRSHKTKRQQSDKFCHYFQVFWNQ